MNRIIVLIFLIIVVLFCLFNGYLFISNIQLNRSLGEIEAKKNKEFQNLLIREQELMKRELDLKYKENITAYGEAFKNLESEKKKLKELEEKLK